MRLFIAATFPEHILRDLNTRVAGLRPRLPAASWAREETQHLTFAFLGDQPESMVQKLSPKLEAALAAIPRFNARLRGSGYFPNARHARVGWIGTEPQEKFDAIAQAVRDIVTTAGVKLDGGDFKAHLTMMRMREGWPPSSIELFTRNLRDYTSEHFPVDSVTLFSSQLNPKGAVHTPLHTFALGASE